MGKVRLTFHSGLYYFLIIALIIGGTHFTKFNIVGPLYLHDLVLILAVVTILIRPPRFFRFTPINVLILISMIYLGLSIVWMRTSYDLILRQYAIFGYLICYYLIFWKSLSQEWVQIHSNFLIFVASIACLIQVVYVIYLLASGVSIFDDYNYYSPAIVLGLIIAGAGVLIFIPSPIFKIISFCLLLILSTTSGHSSAALSLLIVFGGYFVFNVTSKSKIILSLLGIFSILIIYLAFPQFQDVNAGFRLISWAHTVKRIVVDNYGVLGEGFGIPYFDNLLIFDLYNSVGSTGFFGAERVNEPYLSSVHNSFLTIFLSVGLLPGLLIFHPAVKLYKYLMVRNEVGNKNADFIFLSLIGLFVWVSFNEILELPHSAGLFWFVYFCSIKISWYPSAKSQDEFLSS